MAQYKGFVFDGINSADYGVVITGASTYSAPERAVEMFDIPGRNGALAIDQGRFANIEITYHCAMADRNQATFAQRLSALRNQLCSRYSYVRLTDDYNSDEYRLALYKSGLDADLVIDRGGEFDVVFDCKPQRFLTSGESTYQIGEWGQTITETGDIVTYQGDDLTAVKSLTTDLEPIQDLHGYDSPWVGGAGKNLIPFPYYNTTKTTNNVTFTVQDDGGIKITTNGTASANADFMLANTNAITLAAGTYTFSRSYAENVEFIFGGASNTSGISYSNTTSSQTVEATQTGTIGHCLLRIPRGKATNATVYPQIELGATATDYAPYSNICPIYGRTGQTVTVTGKNLLPNKKVAYSTHTWLGTDRTSNLFYCYLPIGTYTMSAVLLSASAIWIRSSKATSNTRISGEVATTTPTGSFTVTEADYYRFWIDRVSPENVVNFQLELGSTAIAYEPYAGTTYTRSFVDGQGNTLTVYGGEDEIVGGVLTVERIMAEFDGSSDENWKYEVVSGNGNFYIAMPSTVKAAQYKATGLICNTCPASTINRSEPGRAFISNAKNFNITIADIIGVSTAADFKTWLQSNHIQVVCDLVTPQTYQLTANEVTTLIGTNHVWSDAGEVTVEYGTDPYTMVNDTPFPSKPLIKVTGYGEVGFGDITITITGTAGVVTYIDCDLMECYRMSGGAIVPANQYVTFTGTDFPTIPTGKTRVTSASTISKVEVVPRWWII